MSAFHLGMRSFHIVLLGSLGLFTPAMAAPVPSPGDQDLIRDRQDRLLEEQQRRLEELRDLPGKGAKPVAPVAPVDTRCFPIKDIGIKGTDSLSLPDRDRLLEPYIGGCLGTSQLNQLLKVITDNYIDRGLVTSRAYLPQQDLSNGQLQVLVVEGKLEALQGAEHSKLSDRELAMAFPGKNGELLNLREIEQAIDQLNRLPSNQAQLEIVPGDAVGGSSVLVKNTPQKPWRASLSRHNDGQKTTGEQQWGAGFEWDSPLGLADQMLDEKTGQPYYVLRTTVSEDALAKLHGLVIKPGMPAEMFVRTGERSLLNYLFKPLLDRAGSALTEE
ncbi:hemolysin activation/secretion protein [Pseudomonas costantinii]|uniref:Hemolysin activation/secretion protein n=1 Tax=Pseudomonas costantinii TaxID=168469 RepID=A0A1H4YT28_9PSED|nr:hemolysin activation/secretion protein [Pseudomonas costantinii]